MQNFKEFKERLLKATKEGPITEWTERIAELAQRAGLPVERIDWKGSPNIVAGNVIVFAEAWDISAFQTALMKAESKLQETVEITQYLLYEDEEWFQITSELIAPVSLLPALKTLKRHGFKLAYDWSKSQGLDIIANADTKVGHVKVWSNDKWLDELVADIKSLAKDLD